MRMANLVFMLAVKILNFFLFHKVLFYSKNQSKPFDKNLTKKEVLQCDYLNRGTWKKIIQSQCSLQKKDSQGAITFINLRAVF